MSKRKPTLIDQLSDLDATVEAAQRRAGLARDERRRRSHQAFGIEATAELTAYVTDVEFRKRSADQSEHRRLTAELLEPIASDDNYVLNTLGRGGNLQVVDISINEELKAAEAEAVAAELARNEFATENFEGLAVERKAAKMGAIREALEGDDPASLKSALGSPAAA